MAGAVLRFCEVGRVALLTLVGEGLTSLAVGVAGLCAGLGGVVVGIGKDDELCPLRYSR